MKKSALIVSLVLSLATTGLIAQPPGFGHRGPGGMNGPGGPGGDHQLFRIAHALDLSEAQQEDWKDALAQHRESLQPLFDEMKMIQEQLDVLLGLDDPDPAEVGLLVIDQRGLRNDIGDSRGLLEAQLTDLLTPEQLAKWDEIKEEGRGRGHDGHGPRGRHGRPA